MGMYAPVTARCPERSASKLNGSTNTTFTDAVQKRLEQKLRAWPTDRMPALEERAVSI